MTTQPFFSFVRPLAVVAFGGNALLRPEDQGTQEEQMHRARKAARWLLPVLNRGYEIIIVHGNGPQVGNILLQVEEAANKIPPQSLDVCVSQTQGSIGYMLELAIGNELRAAGYGKEVATLVTQVEVDAADPAFLEPTKPIGPFFSSFRAKQLMEQSGWQMVEDAGRGWRKVVASPKPRAIRGVEAIATLINRGYVVIAAGGGGIPVIVSESGGVIGVESVIDKDYAASMLASSLSADLFIILTGVARIARDFGKPDQEDLAVLGVSEARRLLAEGQFPAGSMGPKVDAAIQFVERGGREVLVTRAESLQEAMEGRSGTYIRRQTPDGKHEA
jgi:carbamate kinase